MTVLICEPRGAIYNRGGLTYFLCRTCGEAVGSFRRRVCPAGESPATTRSI